jgi:RimJ/RimL family protein N-acetyltransferase
MTLHPRTEPLRTARLILREWEERDHLPFAAMNADENVMRYFNACLTRAESDDFIRRMQEHFRRHGFSFWAVELKESGELIGLTGLARPKFDAPFTPCVEIGWRFSPAHWGRGYATEAARAALDAGFGAFGLTEIVSFTAVQNTPSQKVMARLGMTHDAADDFDHPNLPAAHVLRRHVLYRMECAVWSRAASV